MNPTLYSGSAGVVLALVEGHEHFGDQRYADAAVAGARGIATQGEVWDHDALHLGLTGMAFALDAVGERYRDEGLRASARRALDRVRSRFDGERWSVQIELLGGNADIALGALAMADLDLGVLATEPSFHLAEKTRAASPG